MVKWCFSGCSYSHLRVPKSYPEVCYRLHLVLKAIFYLGFGSVSRFLSKLGRVFVMIAFVGWTHARLL
eukprot:SAG11_NODE_142_length_14906_cov_8.352333_5_plen_68_part_00